MQEAVIIPLRAALSQTAVRAYITTILAFVAGFLLFGLAILSYILFYWSYIPRIGFERAIHLQFDNVFQPTEVNSLGVVRTYPYAYVDIAPDIISNQRYDVAIEITLPRTPENLNAGNFMLDVTLLGPEKRTRAGSSLIDSGADDVLLARSTEDAEIIAHSRRPSILQYRSRIVDLAYRLTEIQWYVLGVRHESEKLHIKIFDGVSFAKGWRNVPTSLRLEVQSVRRMQFYNAKVTFKARFTGLRYFMYNHQMIAAVIFISWFWATEVLFAGVVWAAFVYSDNDPNKIVADEVDEVATKVKREKDVKEEMSDTDRTFPTVRGQASLKYQSPDVKQEEMPVPIQAAPVAGLEADDEDEDGDFFVDSGIGTSLESGPGRSDSMRKRRGRLSPGGSNL